MDLNNANSEHSRHGYFRGRLVIDGVALPESLMEIVKSTLAANPREQRHRVQGQLERRRAAATIETLVPGRAGPARRRWCRREATYHVIFTAETHNFPTGVAPFPGAETGTGGRIRDVQGTGRGGFVVAGTAAYCVANLLIPGYALPWETPGLAYPGNIATRAGDRDRGLQRRLGLRQQVRRAADPGVHALLRPGAAGRRALGVAQADHVHRRDRPDRRRATPRRPSPRPGCASCRSAARPTAIGFGGGAASSHAAGGERRGAGLQRGAARRRRDGAADEPGDPRLQRDGRGHR